MKKIQRIGKNQQKILTILLAGLSMGLTRSPKAQWKILKDIPKELCKVDTQSIEYGLHRLYAQKYIYMKECGRKNYIPQLTKEGKLLAERYSVKNVSIPIQNEWDKKWRMVFFDIPEKFRKRRDNFRFHLRRIGFREIQRSTFCFPYECGKEIMQIASSLYILPYIHYAVVSELSDDELMKPWFDLH